MPPYPLVNASGGFITFAKAFHLFSVAVTLCGLNEYVRYIAELDFGMGMPTISKNPVYVVEGGTTNKLLFNLIPFGIWYAQHMGMARTSYKDFMQKLTEKYVFFERSLYILFSGIAVFILTYTFQPIEGVLIELPEPVMLFGWGLFVAGLGVFAWSIIDMGETGPFGFGIMN